MKVLFAVNNDNISEAIVKKYQRDYKEVLSYKNVYYFNAILKELQNDRTYDRIVISEDLEPFANNNYDTIDKFLFEKLEKIKEEATAASGKDIEIVIICADRRSKSDDMLNKIFGIKIYNALIGDDRNIEDLCRLINRPRTKNEAKIAYKIEGNRGGSLDDENGVSELEVQNILAHYKRLGKNEDKYVDSFNNIVSQYTDAQLKIIIRYLPLNVKAVLEEQSPKYRELSEKSALTRDVQEYTPKKLKTIKQQENSMNVKMLNNEKDVMTKPIVIPSELNNKSTVKITKKENKKENVEEDLFSDDIQETPKKGRGRPKKIVEETAQVETPKRGRGRPKKQPVNEQEDFDIDLFNIESSQDKNEIFDNTIEDMEFDLFNMGQEETVEKQEEIDALDLFNLEIQDDNAEESVEQVESDDIKEEVLDIEEQEETFEIDNFEEDEENVILEDDNIEIDIDDYDDNSDDDYDFEEIANINQEEHHVEPIVKNSERLNSLLTNEKKIVSFVGTTKNGTSFIVNNLALVLAEMNISTAILDMTQNRNSYYIFNNNDERLRNIAENSISNLEQGIAQGIKVQKNLTVYTQMPGEKREQEDIESILVTLMENHDIVLIDTDFNTNVECFAKSHEIYLVQSMDILTIQPLTVFLRNLKSKDILRQEKIKIVINKEQKLRTLTDNLLIGGMSSYNDPSMTLMTELFNKESVKYCKIPFDMQNYAKYLDSLVNCEIYLRGYTKQFLSALNQLAEMVYPLINKSKYESKGKQKRKMEFSNETKNTLNKMKKNY